jgi:hypothetical protein
MSRLAVDSRGCPWGLKESGSVAVATSGFKKDWSVYHANALDIAIGPDDSVYIIAFGVDKNDGLKILKRNFIKEEKTWEDLEPQIEFNA